MGFGNMVQARVYWSPANGVDTNDGQSGRPVKTWPRALELLSTQDDDEWIYLNDEYTVSTTTTMDGTISGHANARIKRNNGNGSGGKYMFKVDSGVTLTLKNILIDGKRDSSIPYADDVRSMIVASGNVVLDNGAILRDNWVKDESEPHGGAVRLWSGGTLTMNAGSLISNCRVYKDGSTKNYRGGAIMSGASCRVTINGGTIENCYSMGWGGAISLAGGTYTFNMSGGTITGCHAGTYGGAIHIADDGGNHATATVNITGGVIDNCYTQATGGGIFVSCTNTSNVVFSGGEVKNCRAANGGGIYIKGGATSLTLSGGSVNYCSATANGGGIYAVSLNQFKITGTSKIDHCSADTQTATNDGRGGGIIVDQCDLEIDGQGVEVSYNHARCYGGGVQIGGGKLYLKNGKIHHNTGGIKRGETNGDSSYAYGAAGIHLSGADFYMTGGEVYANVASTLGGGLHASSTGSTSTISITKGKIYDNIAYKQGGGLHINTNTSIEFTANSDVEMYGNKACVGGAILLDGGSLILRAGNFHDNQALNTGDYANNNFAAADQGCGGAFGLITENTSNSAVASFTLNGNVTVTNNTASNKGGAAYLKAPGVPALASGYNTISLSQGTMNGNHAGNGGGALYVNRGNITINGGEICNNTAGANGGGIYFDAASSMTVGNGDMNIKGNTANGIPNNVYLLSGKTIAVASGADFRPVYFGVYTANRTPNIPVFTGSETQLQNIYDGMVAVPATRNVVDDSQCFSPYLPSPKTTLYFGSSPWSPLQQTVRRSTDLVDADGDGYYDIGSVKQLTAFLWLVNGITTHDSNFSPAVPSAKGELTADFSMDGHYWVPFASYTGTFNGAGYIISDLTMVPTNVSTERGLFGVNASGTIKNVNLRDCFFAGDGSYIGTVVAQMNGGTLYNSVAQSEVEATSTSTKAGGLVGHINGGTVHSCIATSEMTGYTMGGLAGKVSSGSLYNSFANPLFHYSGPDGSTNYYVGGLVADNGTNGTVQNCYVRFSRTQRLTNALFGQLAGNNGGSITDCYTPLNYTSDVPATIVHTGSATSDTYKVADAPYKYNRPNDNKVGSTDETLTVKLNGWVSSKISSNSEYAYWKRTTAGGYGTGGNINDDYPIHKMKGLSNAASPDGLFIEYKYSLDAMLTKYNALEDGGTVWVYDSPLSATTASGGTPSYESVSVNNNGAKVKLYIDEEASLLQYYNANSASDNNTLTAYTSQTLPGSPRSWHFLSSSLSNSGIGFNYGQNALFNWEPNPCHVTISNDDDAALFPSDLPMSGGYADVARIDLYAFYEPEYHWINLKRNSNSHWHMNATTEPIAYTNETTLTPGKGYLVSIDKDQLLQNRGTLNNGEVEIALGYTPAQEWAGLVGYNLIGNPYQSYLDFPAFASQNSGLWYDGSKGKAVEPTYAVYDSEMGGYIQYKEGASRGSKSASGILNMHQGFMVRSSGATRAKFTNAMRTNEGNGVSFRGEQPAYPLINLTVTDDESHSDVAVLELGREREEGAEKLRANTCKGWLYLHYGDDDYAILFRGEVEDYQPLWFEASEVGTYTLSWETANGEFEALTLVDNIMGTRTDMLTHDRYVFEGNPEQYKSRFKIEIGNWKDTDENLDGPSTGSGAFAFVNNGNLVVNGEGTLQLFDVTGRCIYSATLSGTQSITALPDVTAGVYVLRLSNNNETRTQKIILE